MPAVALHASPDRVKFLEGPAVAAKLSAAELDEKVTGYLPSGAPDIVASVSNPPVTESVQDKADVALFRDINATAGGERWKIAVADTLPTRSAIVKR